MNSVFPLGPSLRDFIIQVNVSTWPYYTRACCFSFLENGGSFQPLVHVTVAELCGPALIAQPNGWLENIRWWWFGSFFFCESFQVMWCLDDYKNTSQKSSIIKMSHADPFHDVPFVFLLKTDQFQVIILGNVLFLGKINLII